MTLLQRGGYEVYIVEVSGASHEECLRRNIHNRSADDIAEAVQQWQPTPPTYPLLDVGPLLGMAEKQTKQVRDFPSLSLLRCLSLEHKGTCGTSCGFMNNKSLLFSMRVLLSRCLSVP